MKKVLFFLTNNKNLKEICVGSIGLEKGSLGLPDTRWQRELDLRVVHLLDKRSTGLASFDGLNANNLNAVGTGSVTGSHIPVAGSHGGRNCQVTVFTVHVVGTRPGLGDYSVWSEDSHTVQGSLGFILRWQFTANYPKFTKWFLCLHFHLVIYI